jgi:hypothetical protein
MTQAMESDERKELIETFRRIAAELGTDSVSRPEFLRRSGVSERKVQRLSGAYNGLVEAAGMGCGAVPHSKPGVGRTSSPRRASDEGSRALRRRGPARTGLRPLQCSPCSTGPSNKSWAS